MQSSHARTHNNFQSSANIQIEMTFVWCVAAFVEMAHAKAQSVVFSFQMCVFFASFFHYRCCCCCWLYSSSLLRLLPLCLVFVSWKNLSESRKTRKYHVLTLCSQFIWVVVLLLFEKKYIFSLSILLLLCTIIIIVIDICKSVTCAETQTNDDKVE